ncbi:hypothetical protein EVAR_28525_1 [Eumeta japonica]|uniref:tRNA-splicing endonuclease subunit Sen15 domain-containing protein n=1 Tax=Eumeta variegata TaxID=151549 RepID=A0A4C1WRJ7_EUMVA|nr:hypothetical protein EVAR_28525_1 [Eumeta japonica]
MDGESKIKEDMMSLGCQSKLKIALAYQLYMYLIDVKLMYDVEYCYNQDIDILYIVAKPSKNEKMNIYVPVLTSEEVSMNQIETLQENLCTIESGPSINLAFIEGDTTTVIYTFTRDLVHPQADDGLLNRKTREQRRSFIDGELRKNRSQILQQTLDGGVVDDDCQIIE